MKVDAVMRKLVSSSPKTREQGRNQLRKLAEAGIGEADAVVLLRLVTETELPREEHEWIDSRFEVFAALWGAAYPSLLPRATAAYRDADDNVRSGLLALMSATGSPEGAVALVDAVRQYGWPPKVYPRVWLELAELAETQTSVLFPSLLDRAGPHFLDIANVALGALSTGRLPASALAGVVSIVRTRLAAVLDDIEPLQQPHGIAWRFAEQYAPRRAEAGLLLDLAAWIPDAALEVELARGARLADPWPALFATTALLRRGNPVDETTISRLAESAETRALLFSQLERLGELARFPLAYASLDAMAEADMVRWLKFPTELGREPERLEKMATFDSDDGLRLYVWRFTGFEGEWAASVSGPYEVDAPPGPVSGASTFSRFEAWEYATVEDHAARAVETLDAWRKSWQR
jgi:hypothetical protein